MPTIYIMVGLPGSGKSYQANIIRRETGAAILSSDQYRLKMYGSVSDQSHNAKVFEKLYKDAREKLNEGKDVILDSTNITLKSRRNITHQFSNIVDIKFVAVVMVTPYEICVVRDSEREVGNGYCGVEVIEKYLRSFQCPQYFEGFSEIEFAGQYLPVSCDSYEIKKRMENFDQHNPHHLYNLKEHCDRLANSYVKDSIPNTAGKWHDIGKMYTQKLDDKGIAHYYGHAEVGTYFLLCNYDLIANSYTRDYSFLETLFFINYHMLGHQIKTKKAIKKYRNIFGDERFEDLMEFVENDKYASGTY